MGEPPAEDLMPPSPFEMMPEPLAGRNTPLFSVCCNFLKVMSMAAAQEVHSFLPSQLLILAFSVVM